MERIGGGASPDLTYYILTVLSTLIAAYGLLSNSTATVIGAMIVAPLMGPILGVALALVTADSRMFRRSLTAEVSGAILVILAAFAVATVTGVDQIDFSASEIANRTRPTLFDMAIGLAAGLAGAFCMVHPALQASIAGVAIAVALVPPLAVTGITAAGWFHGIVSFRPVFGSFILFLANYLTIEVASCVLFYAIGFHSEQGERTRAGFRRAIAINAILLVLTGIFLTHQLTKLVRERVGLVTARKVLREGLAKVPGADLDKLEAVLEGQTLSVRAAVASRRDFTPAMVGRLQDDLTAALEGKLSGVTPQLVLRTVPSVFASSTGYLFEPEVKMPSAQEVRKQAVEAAIREAVQRFPGVGLDDLQLQTQGEGEGESGGGDSARTEITVTSPYEFSPVLVAQLQESVNQALAQERQKPLTLTVKTVYVSSATEEQRLSVASPDPSRDPFPELRQTIGQEIEREGGFQVVGLTVKRTPAQLTDSSRGFRDALSEEGFQATAEVRGPNLLDGAVLEKVRQRVLARQPRPIDLEIRAVSTVSDTVIAPSAEPEPTPTAPPTLTATPAATPPTATASP